MKISVLLFSAMLFLSYGCKKKLPKCDSEKTKDLIVEIFEKNDQLQGILKKTKDHITGYSDHQEVSFDEDKQKRICTVKVSTTKESKKFKYQVKWLNKKKGKFEVKIIGLSK